VTVKKNNISNNINSVYKTNKANAFPNIHEMNNKNASKYLKTELKDIA